MTNPQPDEVNSGALDSKPSSFDDFFALNSAAASKYNRYLLALLENDPNHPAPRYIRKRGITTEDIKAYQLGYAPAEWTFMAKSLLEVEGVGEKALEMAIDCGLVKFKGGGRRPTTGGTSLGMLRDTFHDRLIFPLRNAEGNLTGFTGRLLKATSKKTIPKYLNTEANAVFDKGEILFGLSLAKRRIQTAAGRRHLTLTEGQTDVIALHRAGILDVAGKGGTALTEQQVKILSDTVDHVTLIYDEDPNGSGQKALNKDIDTLLLAGIRVSVFPLSVAVAPKKAAKNTPPVVKIDADSWVFRSSLPNRTFTANTVDAFSSGAPLVMSGAWKESIEAIAYPVLREVDLTADIKRHRYDALMMWCLDAFKKADDSDDLDESQTAREVVTNYLAHVKDDSYREDYIKRIAERTRFSRKVLSKEVIARRKELLGSRSGEADVAADELPDWIEDPIDFFTWGFAERLVKGDPRKTGYYFQGGMGTVAVKPSTNFVLKPLYHIMDKGNVRRLAEVDNGFKSRVIELNKGMLTSQQNFEAELSDYGNFMVYDDFDKKHLKRIIGRLMAKTPEVHPIKQLGVQPEGFFAFSNAVYNGHLEKYNDHGVVEIDGQHYFSPSFATALGGWRQDNDTYKQDRYLSHVETSITFGGWGQKMLDVYGERAFMAMLFVPVVLFKDIVIRSAKVPIFYCYGPKDSGKSTFAESILYLFFSGKDGMGAQLKPLNFAAEPTLSAFWSAMQRYRNCPMILNEFDENTVKDWAKTALKSAWDNESRQRMNKDGNGQLEEQSVNCAPIVVGQYLADSDDGSVVSRSLVFEFKSRKEHPFTPSEKEQYSELQSWERKGLSGILTQLLPLRPYVEEHFAKTMASVNKEFFEYLDEHGTPVQNRTLQNMVCLLTMFDLLKDQLDWPMEREAVWEYARHQIVDMNRLLHESDKLVSFWTTVGYLFGKGTLAAGWDFKIDVAINLKIRSRIGQKEEHKFDQPRKILYLRLNNVAPTYAEQVWRTSKTEALKPATLEVYLKQTPYYLGSTVGIWFINPQTGKGTSSSCLILDYDMLTNRVDLTLEEHEGAAERPTKTLTGILASEARSVPVGEISMWELMLEVHTFEAGQSDQYRVKVMVEDHLVNKEKLKVGSRWRVSGSYSERAWERGGQTGISRRLDANEIETLPDGPIANQIDTSGFTPTDEQPF